MFPIFLALKYFNHVIFFEKYFIVTMLFLQKMFMIRLKEEYDNNIFKDIAHKAQPIINYA